MQRVIRRQTPQQVRQARQHVHGVAGLGALTTFWKGIVANANAALDQGNAAVTKADVEAAIPAVTTAYEQINDGIVKGYLPYATYNELRRALYDKKNALVSWLGMIVRREQAVTPPPPEPPVPPPPTVQPAAVDASPVPPPPPPPAPPTVNPDPIVRDAIAAGMSVDAYKALLVRRSARGVVDAQTSAIKGILDLEVRPGLFPTGYQLFEMEPQMWKMVQYTQANYACTPENVMKIAFRADIYAAAQKGLADLLAISNQPPFSTPLPDVGTPERLLIAQLYADWLTCVYTWVSLAYFAVNVQPAFLNADSPETAVQGGQKVPLKTPGEGLPSELQSLQNELIGTNNAMLDKFARSLSFGPQWAEWWTTGEATSWLAGDFAPWRDPICDLLSKTWTDGIDGVYPEGYAYGKTLPSDIDSAKIKSRFLDPWFFWYASFAHRPIDEIGSPWFTINKHAVRDADRERFFVPGPAAMLRAAKAWANHILSRSLADQVTRSAGWYLTNYVPYWTTLLGGNIEVTIDEVRAGQKAAADARVTAKQQTTAALVNASMSTATAVASAINPIAGGVAAGVSILANGVMRLAFWRRKRKKKPKYDLMQPLMLRTLSDPDCSFFPGGVSLPETLTRILTVVQAEIGDPNMVATLPKITSQPTSQPANALAPSTAQQTVTAEVPATPALPVDPALQGGASAATGAATSGTVRTSNSADLPTATAMPTPQDTQAAIAAAARTPPNPNAVAPAVGGVPWTLVAAGAAGVGLLVYLRRR